MCNYTPFGWGIPSRKLVLGKSYRYGFNGVEQDEEWNGGQSVAFEFRTEDPRIGRFLSTDPLTATTPWETPYAFAGNSPVVNIDYLGLSASNANGAAPPSKRRRGGNFLKGLGKFFMGLGQALASGGGSASPIQSSQEMTSTIQYARNGASDFSQQLNTDPPKHGDVRTLTERNPLFSISYTQYYHGGNDYLETGWYDYDTYAIANLDYENGQVMLPQSELSMIGGYLLDGVRRYSQNGVGYAVDRNGYIDLSNAIVVAEAPWWLSFGRNPKSLKDAAKALRKMKPSPISPGYGANARHIFNYNKSLLAIQKFISTGGRPGGISKKVWTSLSVIEQKKFRTAIQKGVVGAEGQKGVNGIIRLKDTNMMSKGYTHKLKIGNSDKRIYGSKVDGSWQFDKIKGHD
ncbi:MAG: RHS repeat-associated core domain-containing protein [Aureispira sp.]